MEIFEFKLVSLRRQIKLGLRPYWSPLYFRQASFIWELPYPVDRCGGRYVSAPRKNVVCNTANQARSKQTNTVKQQHILYR